MEETTLVHKSCKGRIVVNVVNLFRLLSPSIAINTAGFSVGVMEMSENPDGKHSFVCANCQEEFSSEEIADVAEVRCQCCRGMKPVSKMYTCPQIAYLCESCKGYLTGETPNPPENIARVMNYVDLRRAPVKMVKLSDILKKKISL